MITDLFTAVSGIDADALAGVIPPACRRETSPIPDRSVAAREIVLHCPEWRPRADTRHLLPSVCVLTEIPYAARFELSVRTGARWSPWVASAIIGPGEFAPMPGVSETLACDIDLYRSRTAVEAIRLRVRMTAPEPRALAAAPCIVSLSACDVTPLVPAAPDPAPVRLPVPARSQLDAPADIALRICSPVSVAMVLDYWSEPTAVLSLAAEIFHPPTDRYGVWPAAIRAAGRRGVAGYLLRFPDWSAAAWCLSRQLPIIASITYAAGELTGAPMSETSGHLVVLTGHDGSEVLVNDPVGATRAEVPRRCRLDEIQRVWLERTGVGYVLFRL